MSAVILQRPGADIEPRERLRQALDAFNEEQDRVTALTEGQERAQRSLWAANAQLTEAQAELTRVRHTDKADLAYSFLENTARDRAAITAAQAQVEKVERDIEHWREVEQACAGELKGAERRIAIRRVELNEARAAFVLAQPEVAGIETAIADCWRRLRTLTVLGNELISVCGGHIPAALMSRLQRSEPLEGNIVGYPLDDFIQEWRAAFADLKAGNADINLPRMEP